MPLNNISWVHLSDFHSGKNLTAQRHQYKYVIDHLRSLSDSGVQFNFLFVTGDIANRGKAEEYEYYNEHFIRPIKNTFPGIQYFSIPGNHDLDHDQAPYVYREIIRRRAEYFFYPDNNGVRCRKEIIPRFSSYIKHDLSEFTYIDGNHWLESINGSVAHRCSIDGQEIGILGVNTAWFSDIDVPSCKTDCDRFEITPGKMLVEQGLAELSDCDFVIVLGHHPIDWFVRKEVSAIRTLFGKHNVLYLHGHLHKTMSNLDEGAGYNFRVMQSGAAFQAAEHEIWVNRLLHCEFNLAAKYLDAHPYKWSLDSQEWVPDGDAFPPRYRQENSTIWRFPSLTDNDNEPIVEDLYRGWDILDKDRVVALKSNATKRNIIDYFDGMNPSVEVAAASEVSRRHIVYEIVDNFTDIGDSSTTVTTVLGAAGEGKSTVALQCAVDLVSKDNHWRAFVWNSEEPPELSDIFLTSLQSQERRYLLVLDNAELVSKDIVLAVDRLLRSDSKNIHFLLASRHSDWRHCRPFGNSSVSALFRSRLNGNFKEKILRGISKDDARNMVLSWAKFGSDGLRALNPLKTEDAIDQLLQGAEEELLKDKYEGSLLGALIKVRTGQYLKEHIRDLLEKLSNRPIRCQGSHNLRDALGYIAAMHTQNCLYLTRDVLGEALCCEMSDVTREVLHPLGEEALTDKSGERVLVRHRAIADIISNILLEESGWDFESAITDLVIAAENIINSGSYLEHIGLWRTMPQFFSKRGKARLAVTLAKLQVKHSPTDPFTQLGLADLYLSLGMTTQATNALLDAPDNMQLNRKTVNRAGTIFDRIQQPLECMALSWLSLSDAIDKAQPTLRNCKSSLVRIARTSIAAWNRSPSKGLLLIACNASYLFKNLEKDLALYYRVYPYIEAAEHEGVSTENTVESAFTVVRNEMQLMQQQYIDSLPRWVPSFDNISFIGISNLLGIPHRYAM